MTAPFTVRLKTSRRDIHVTNQVMDLQYRKVAPGGYASATISLERPLSFTPDELAYFGKLYVYDGRNARTLWEGRVEDLGRGSDAGGQVWSVNGVGPMAHAQDQTLPLLYQVTDLSQWLENHDGPAWLDRNSINTTAFGSGLQMFVPRDTNVVVGTYQGWINRLYTQLGLKLAQVNFHYGEDITDTNWSWQMTTMTPNHHFSAGSSASTQANIGTDFTAGLGTAQIDLVRSGSTITVASDVTAASFTGLMMRGTMFTGAGVEQVTSGYYSTPLTTTNIVSDLLGRMLPLYDGVNATLDDSLRYAFDPTDQFAYPDGTTAAQVLADLMVLCPGMYWTAGATNPATGLWSFQWRQWPTTVRYEATAEGGFASPSSAQGIYDSVNVRWVDSAGNPQTTIRTLANATLTAAGFHRSTRLDVGSAGSLAAAQVGDQFLAQNAVPPSAGTLTVTKRVLDRLNGWMVDPWDIEPGYLIRVRNVAPTVASNSNRDGVTTFRVVASTVNQGDASATLELDEPSISVSNIIAGMQAQQSYQTRN